MTDVLDIKFDLGAESDAPRYRRLASAVNNAISEGRLQTGAELPSVTDVCNAYGLSRDTVFKAYAMLKEQGVVRSQPGKGFYVSDHTQKVFVFLDTFKAYKEVLYDSFIHRLPKNVIADVNFHHYNPKLFRRLIEESTGRYSKYVIMPFESPDVQAALSQIPVDKLLLIDWNLYAGPFSCVLYQDFGLALYKGLNDVRHLLRKYREFHLIYPEYTNHPKETVSSFEQFCQNNNIDYVVETDSLNFKVQAEVAYLSVSDRMLARLLEQCRDSKLVLGQDVGVISYNETPMKKFVSNGITVFSTDFYQMGQRAADFVVSHDKVRECVPSRMIIRESL